MKDFSICFEMRQGEYKGTKPEIYVSHLRTHTSYIQVITVSTCTQLATEHFKLQNIRFGSWLVH